MNLSDSKKKHTISLLVLIILGFVVFSNTFRNPFMWDDEELIVENKYIQSPGSIPFLFSLQYWKYYAPEEKGWYRPVRVITLAIDHFFWKLNPFGYHLTNLLLHIVNIIIIYFFVLKLKTFTKRKNEPRASSFRQHFLEPAFLTAALFAVHPIHTESVTWIKNRSDLLASIFFLLSLSFFLLDDA